MSDRRRATTTRTEATVIAAVVHDPRASRRELLAQALEQADFWTRLDGVRRGRRRARKALRIVIKTDLTIFDRESPTGTDPGLVEHLIDLLHDKGYADIVVAEATGRADLWAENREVPVLADLAGYRYTTDDGHPYDVVDLSQDLVALPQVPGGVLGGGSIGRAWSEADVRIGFAKNRTDEEEGYALGLANLLHALPLRDKSYHYRHRLAAAEVARDLLKLCPLHFALIDAYVSNHGPAGCRRAAPIETRTIIASSDLMLCDWVGALKMGLDPYVNRTQAALLRSGALPCKFHVVGSYEPYPGWQNVPVLLRDSVRSRNRSPGLSGAVEPWLQSVNTELFPFRSDLDERVNGLLATVTGGRPLEITGLTAVNFWLGAMASAVETGRILADKDALPRRSTALGFAADAYPDSAYEAAADLMLPLADLAAQSPPDRNGLRWRYLDGSVLFRYDQLVDRPYDLFVDRVDIARAVQIMNDNIGGARVEVAVDAAGRVIRQAERDIYLPQPNWIALFGGEVIDVGKLEVIRHEPDRRRIFWRTVTSANDSATYDDGIVTFARAPGGLTAITIIARQKFTLPPAIERLGLDRFPRFKDALVSDAYAAYFSRTIANYLATYEGRDPRLGHDHDSRRGEADATAPHGPVAMIVEAVRQLATLLEPWLMRRVGGHGGGVTDAAGFQHFAGPAPDAPAGADRPAAAPLVDFLGDLVAALRQDLAWYAGPAARGRS